MKQFKFFISISLQIVILFVAAMAFTFLSDYMATTGFFGDVPIPEGKEDGVVDKGFIWGARHYMYWWMAFLLFIAQSVRVIIYIVTKAQKEFDI